MLIMACAAILGLRSKYVIRVFQAFINDLCPWIKTGNSCTKIKYYKNQISKNVWYVLICKQRIVQDSSGLSKGEAFSNILSLWNDLSLGKSLEVCPHWWRSSSSCLPMHVQVLSWQRVASSECCEQTQRAWHRMDSAWSWADSWHCRRCIMRTLQSVELAARGIEWAVLVIHWPLAQQHVASFMLLAINPAPAVCCLLLSTCCPLAAAPGPVGAALCQVYNPLELFLYTAQHLSNSCALLKSTSKSH